MNESVVKMLQKQMETQDNLGDAIAKIVEFLRDEPRLSPSERRERIVEIEDFVVNHLGEE